MTGEGCSAGSGKQRQEMVHLLSQLQHQRTRSQWRSAQYKKGKWVQSTTHAM